MKSEFRAVGAAAILCATSTFAVAEDRAPDRDELTVTTTRSPQSRLSQPADIEIVSGEEARRRGASDLRALLATAAGVEALPGGDMGPAGSVVALQGLAEMDAYLLVVDDIPYGGVFNPATAVFDPIDVERVEIVKGAAPVAYGATSFVGVIHAIRHEAGEQPARLSIDAGTQEFARVAGALSLPQLGGIKQSFLGSAETRGFTQDRSGFTRFHGLYRAGADVGPGRLKLDLEAITLDQDPYSPHPREGGGLSTRMPLDANVNPSDARLDHDRYQINLSYAVDLGSAEWTTTASAARTNIRTTRGFLRDGFATDGVTVNADGYRQKTELNELYVDTHVEVPAGLANFLVGGDWMRGRGSQQSENFEYAVLPDGSNAPASTTPPVDERTMLDDDRDFLGLYGRAILKPIEPVTLVGGVRLNHTTERRAGAESVGLGAFAPVGAERRQKTRVSGSVGADFAVIGGDADGLHLYADYRNTYKPAAIDFGPEAEPDILEPETASSWEAGAKARTADGRFEFDASYFDTRFRNLVIRENVGGLPALENAGRERFRGFDADVAVRPFADALLKASFGRHIARFTDYQRLRPGGAIQQLAGNRLELSPKSVAGFVGLYAPAEGFQGSFALRYVGGRFLNKGNTVEAESYLAADARVGWRRGRYALFLAAENLTDRRDPVAESELGDAQFYRLPGRRVFASFQADFN